MNQTEETCLPQKVCRESRTAPARKERSGNTDSFESRVAREIELMINDRLFAQKLVPEEIYERVKMLIITGYAPK